MALHTLLERLERLDAAETVEDVAEVEEEHGTLGPVAEEHFGMFDHDYLGTEADQGALDTVQVAQRSEQEPFDHGVPVDIGCLVVDELAAVLDAADTLVHRPADVLDTGALGMEHIDQSVDADSNN